ncbi:MaoC family dehydratase [Burkholderia sp. BCC1993]|uniref:MaoC family dehydratase n=1 Tax=Burkholderia sp. BCC1993 TaxID=2817444 RepID=UPI002AAF7443|nr:MaoC family dehydratase [Burkholderia sp. BCC1993]
MQEIRFDDFDALRAFARDDFGPWGPPLVIDQEKIDRFAELTGDRQWIHVDVERARSAGPYGGTIAHGFLTLSLLPALEPLNHVRIVGHKVAINMGAKRLLFLAPVPAGNVLQARARLLDVEPHAKGTLLTFEFAVHVLGQQKPVLLYKSQVLYRS